MGTAQIETRGNEALELAERLRQRRKLRHSTPDGQAVPLDLLDEAILALVSYAYRAGALGDADLSSFNEGWGDR